MVRPTNACIDGLLHFVQTLHRLAYIYGQVEKKVRRDSASTINSFARRVLDRSRTGAQRAAADASSAHRFAEDDIVDFFRMTNKPSNDDDDDDNNNNNNNTDRGQNQQRQGEWVAAIVNRPLPENRFVGWLVGRLVGHGLDPMLADGWCGWFGWLVGW